MKNTLGSLAGGLILLLIVGSYLFGATKILVDDHRYDTKDVVIGFAFFSLYHLGWWERVV